MLFGHRAGRTFEHLFSSLPTSQAYLVSTEGQHQSGSASGGKGGQDSLAAVLQVGFDDVIVGAVQGGAVLEQGLVDAVHVHAGNCGQLRLRGWGKRGRRKASVSTGSRMQEH